MVGKTLAAAAIFIIGANAATDLTSRARAQGEETQKTEKVLQELAALNAKIDTATQSLSRLNDRIESLSKKFDGMLYGSCQNRRICEFH